jgi:hypothetical protein
MPAARHLPEVAHKKAGLPRLFVLRWRAESGHEHRDERQQKNQHATSQWQHQGHVVNNGFHNVGGFGGVRGFGGVGHQGLLGQKVKSLVFDKNQF